MGSGRRSVRPVETGVRGAGEAGRSAGASPSLAASWAARSSVKRALQKPWEASSAKDRHAISRSEEKAACSLTMARTSWGWARCVSTR
jgi:hypothetical protein